MTEQILLKARADYSTAIDIAFWQLKSDYLLDVDVFMQSYAILKKWEEKLLEKEVQTENYEFKLTYKDMRKVVENFILYYEDSKIIRNKDLILSWLFSWRNKEIPENYKEAISVFVKAAETKSLELPVNWRDFIPKL